MVTVRIGLALGLTLSLSVVAISCAEGGGGDYLAPEPPASDDKGAPTPPPSKKASSWKGKPGDNVDWLKYPAQNGKSGSGWGVALTDIAQHLPSSYGDTYWDSDLITAGHETTHGIHAHLRNNFNKTGKKANAFYVLNDRAAIVVEPDIRKSDVAPFIPSSLRGSRYSTYITGQVEWDDTPLYVWDEWNAYANGGDVGVDLVTRGLWKAGWRDGVAGQLEFVVYATAVAMAVEKKDPTYFASYDQFREFLAWNVRRSMTTYRIGAKMDSFKWDEQDKYYARMKSDPGASPWREFVRKYFGAEWSDSVIFGDGSGPIGPPDAGPGGADSGVVDSGGSSDTGSGTSTDSGAVSDAGSLADTGSVVPPDAGSVADSGSIVDSGGVADSGSAESGSADTGGGGTTAGDEDGDGVPDGVDLCSGSPKGADVWHEGEWIGCAAGQKRDGGGGSDSDGDGIPDSKDRCSKTTTGARVWQYGEWIGCAAGQHRDG